MSSTFMGDTLKEKVIFLVVFGAIITVLIFPSFQLSKLQEFIIKQNQQIIDNSNRNYFAEINQSKAGIVRTAILLHDNQRIVQNLTTQLKDRQDVDEKVLNILTSTSEANNKTLTRFGGLENLVKDIHKTGMQAEKNAVLINATLAAMQKFEKSLTTLQHNNNNNNSLSRTTSSLSLFPSVTKTVQLYQPENIQATGIMRSSNQTTSNNNNNNNNYTNFTK